MNNGMFHISKEQVTFFQTFGYLKFPSLFVDSIDEITRAFTEVFESAGARHDGTHATAVLPFIDHHDRLCALLDDPRIDAICSAIMGDDYNFIGSDGAYYVGDTNWHADWWHPTLTYVKFAFYLDSLRRHTGALRVIPGSNVINDYRCALGDAVVDCRNTMGITGAEVPAVAIEVDPGDLVCFNLNTLHATFGGSDRRRMFTLNTCARHADDQVEPLNKFMANSFQRDHCFSPRLLNGGGQSRRRHLEQVLELERAAKSKPS